jgi:ribonuclease P protein component
MLPQNERLKASKEFTAVYNIKKSVANSMLVLYLGKKKENPEISTKVGFVVGKKVHKRANQRNRAKRLMREAYRSMRSTNPELISNYETMIFLARLPILEANYNQVYEAVNDCLKIAKKRFGEQYQNA